MMSSCNLTDGGFSGSKFTWCNNRIGRHRILQRLDRGLLSPEWVAKFSTTIAHLHRTCSDHAPLLVTAHTPNATGSCFRFLNVWTRHANFLKVVEENWDQPQAGRPMVRMAL